MHGGSAPQVIRKARERLALAHITPERTLLELARLAYADVASFWNTDGTLKKPWELDEDQRATLASFEACIQNNEAGDGKQDLVHKYKTWDKTRALEMLAKYFGMQTERIEVALSGEVEKRLAAARARAAGTQSQVEEQPIADKPVLLTH